MLTFVQLRHRLRWVRQQLRRPELAVIGGYHGGNLGDMTLGLTCREILGRCGVPSGLQTIYSLERWPAARFAIVGGGAVGYRECLEQLVARYRRNPERVAILGVDFNDEQAVVDHRYFLRRVSLISCRSADQAAAVGALLRQGAVLHHADLVFAYPGGISPNNGATRRERILGVNCALFFWKKAGDQYEPGTDWEPEVRRRSPHLVSVITELGPKYIAAFSALLKRAREEGWQVWHLPFSPEDDRFARHFFGALVDKYWPYSPNPRRMLLLMRHCERILPTRFHSLVMALITQTPVLPFCYAEKSQHVFNSLGVPEVRKITSADLLGGAGVLLEVWNHPVTVPLERLEEAAKKVQATLELALARVRHE